MCVCVCIGWVVGRVGVRKVYIRTYIDLAYRLLLIAMHFGKGEKRGG